MQFKQRLVQLVLNGNSKRSPLIRHAIAQNTTRTVRADVYYSIHYGLAAEAVDDPSPYL